MLARKLNNEHRGVLLGAKECSWMQRRLAILQCGRAQHIVFPEERHKRVSVVQTSDTSLDNPQEATVGLREYDRDTSRNSVESWHGDVAHRSA